MRDAPESPPGRTSAVAGAAIPITVALFFVVSLGTQRWLLVPWHCRAVRATAGEVFVGPATPGGLGRSRNLLRGCECAASPTSAPVVRGEGSLLFHDAFAIAWPLAWMFGVAVLLLLLERRLRRRAPPDADDRSGLDAGS